MDRTVILSKVKDNPPNGPTEKALNGGLIVTEANDVGNAHKRDGSGSSACKMAFVGHLNPVNSKVFLQPHRCDDGDTTQVLIDQAHRFRQ